MISIHKDNPVDAGLWLSNGLERSQCFYGEPQSCNARDRKTQPTGLVADTSSKVNRSRGEGDGSDFLLMKSLAETFPKASIWSITRSKV